jgi:hypothetical protein
VTTNSVKITVNPLPTPTISGTTNPICETKSDTYTTESGMTNYVWIVSAGGSVTSGGSPTDNTVTVKWNTAGAQTISVNYTNGTNCTAATPKVIGVTVNPLPATSTIWHN